jgi:hypothetical protein
LSLRKLPQPPVKVALAGVRSRKNVRTPAICAPSRSRPELGLEPTDRTTGALWHFPAGHPDWRLASTLPCGGRTFLDPGEPGPRPPSLQLAHRPACFGLSLAAEKKERFFYCYGQPVLADLPIKRFRNSSARSFRPKPTARNDLSLAYGDCSLPNHRRRVKVPGLPLRCHANPND